VSGIGTALSTWEACLLGVVQGLTEFLPVSSSAHLILARAFFGWDAGVFGLAFDVACHVGTLLAVVAYFWRDVLAMAAALRHPFADAAPARLLRLIVIGTVPVVVVALLFNDFLENTVRTAGATAVTLAIGAIGLFVAERLRAHTRGEGSISVPEAIGFGLAESAALVPGISRSGATITFGMLMGLRREAAARFSFLLGVPAILAAAAKEGLELTRASLAGEQGAVFAVGIVSSAVVGYLTVRYFLRFLVKHRLDAFAWYRLVLAGAVVVRLVWR
jgi:undecaprenyl-diphosphatase